METRDPKSLHARDIMNEIHDVMWLDWDPIGVRELGGPEDEYDSYIGGAYRLLAQGENADALVDYLYQIETDAMGGALRDKNLLRPVAEKLLKINVTLEGA
jgi:hypothetical protein